MIAYPRLLNFTRKILRRLLRNLPEGCADAINGFFDCHEGSVRRVLAPNTENMTKRE
jgi:hypothetical protein